MGEREKRSVKGVNGREREKICQRGEWVREKICQRGEWEREKRSVKEVNE